MIAPMPSRRRTHTPPPGAAPDTPDEKTAAPDDETRRALALFNQRLAQEAATARAQRNLERAARAKDDAAARVRALDADSKATATQRAEAAAAYHAAVAAWELARNGDEPPAAEA
jgi:hypothetical protein